MKWNVIALLHISHRFFVPFSSKIKNNKKFMIFRLLELLQKKRKEAKKMKNVKRLKWYDDGDGIYINK